MLQLCDTEPGLTGHSLARPTAQIMAQPGASEIIQCASVCSRAQDELISLWVMNESR